ncbi:hypothetical protein GQR58_020042 [Nymphon striatum]|nr:hypothetical protein GQR58_020042 [Nymphon striatum]
MEKYHVDILGITETKKKGQNEQMLNDKYLLMYSGVNQAERAKASVGLIIKENLVKHNESWNYKSERVMDVDMELHNKLIRGIYNKKKELTNNTKLAIYYAVYSPTSTYASKSWVLTTNDKSRIQAAEMKYFRRVLDKTRRDQLRNVRIREELNCEPLLNKIRKAQLRWFGHVNRMTDEKISKEALEYKV